MEVYFYNHNYFDYAVSMRKVKTQLVGMKHRNVDESEIAKIVNKPIKLKTEPTNKFDKFAIKSLSDNIHFGYVEATNSEKVSILLNKSEQYKIQVIDFDQYKISVAITFDDTEQSTEFVKLSNGDIAGVYQISFKYEGRQFCYIGQSININSRLRTHYRNLENVSHHNDLMEHSWLTNKQSFNHCILERCPKNLSPLDRQIFLFKKEFSYILNSIIPTANKIDADFVINKESLFEMKDLVNKVKIQLKKTREIHLQNKEKIGKKIIDVGIMQERKFWDGWQRAGEPNRYLQVQASNILTWLNKTRYGYLDFRPPINRNHPLYEDLYQCLKAAHKKVIFIDKQRKFFDEFFIKIKKKEKYETCNFDDFEKFIEVLQSVKEG